MISAVNLLQQLSGNKRIRTNAESQSAKQLTLGIQNY